MEFLKSAVLMGFLSYALVIAWAIVIGPVFVPNQVFMEYLMIFAVTLVLDLFRKYRVKKSAE